MINEKYLDWRTEGYTGANEALRLLLILRKTTDRPIYEQKIWFLKFLINKNDPNSWDQTKSKSK